MLRSSSLKARSQGSEVRGQPYRSRIPLSEGVPFRDRSRIPFSQVRGQRSGVGGQGSEVRGQPYRSRIPYRSGRS